VKKKSQESKMSIGKQLFVHKWIWDCCV